MDVNHNNIRRPIVRLIEDPNGSKIEDFTEIDLMKQNELEIVEVTG